MVKSKPQIRKGNESRHVVIALPLAYQDGVDCYRGIMRYLNAHVCNWRLTILRGDFSLEDFHRLSAAGIDAVIASNFTRRETFGVLLKSAVPLVAVNIPDVSWLSGRRKNLVFVDIDSDAIGQSAADYLLGLENHADFACVGFSTAQGWSNRRVEAFVRSLAQKGKPCSCFTLADEREASHSAELIRWLRSLTKPATLFVTCDRLAAPILDVCERESIRVPEELAVLGVDNELITCAHTHPSLSSIQPDFEDEGYRAAESIDRMLKGLAVPRRIVCPIKNVVCRRSTEASSPAGRLVSQARESIMADFADRALTVGSLAKRLKVSRRLLDLRYRQITGITVLDEIRTQRLRHARELVMTTSLTLSEIAALSGFATESYLSRSFATAFGQTPGSLRGLPRSEN